MELKFLYVYEKLLKYYDHMSEVDAWEQIMIAPSWHKGVSINSEQEVWDKWKAVFYQVAPMFKYPNITFLDLLQHGKSEMGFQ